MTLWPTLKVCYEEPSLEGRDFSKFTKPISNDAGSSNSTVQKTLHLQPYKTTLLHAEWSGPNQTIKFSQKPGLRASGSFRGQQKQSVGGVCEVGVYKHRVKHVSAISGGVGYSVRERYPLQSSPAVASPNG